MKLPRLFSSGMVVQHGVPIPVWGWGRPNQRVQVQLNGRTTEGQADAKGIWMVRLPKLHAAEHLGSTLTMTVSADDQVVIDDLLVGDVWLCAGTLPAVSPARTQAHAATAHRPAGKAASRHAAIRVFQITPVASLRPLDDVQPLARWQPASAGPMADDAAFAVHFARSLHEATGLPIGLILAQAPDCLAEAWASRAALASEHALRAILDRADQSGATQSFESPAYRKALHAWQEKSNHSDPGNKGVRRGWHTAAHDDATWPAIELPNRWQAAGLDGAGAMWFRRTITVPKEWKGRAAVLSLGAIDDADTTYLNGTVLNPVLSGPASTARIYAVPGRLLKAGAVHVAVRVFARQAPGGLVGPAGALSLTLALPRTAPPATKRASTARRTVRMVRSVSLAGTWRCQTEIRLPPKDAIPPPLHSTHQDLPAGYNNGMLQPLVPYALRGAIWNQGTRNIARADQYRTLLQAVIRDWRTAWGMGEFPVCVIQLPGQPADRAPGGESPAAELRDAQGGAHLIPHVGVVVTMDLPTDDGHRPPDPQEVGRRLALWAVGAISGQSNQSSGPRYLGHSVSGNVVRITFSHADGGLTTSDGQSVRGVTIAGPDHRFVAAEARIVPAGLDVECAAVSAPAAVRYGWTALPTGNLGNRAGLPAAPFRTDIWALSTQGKR